MGHLLDGVDFEIAFVVEFIDMKVMPDPSIETLIFMKVKDLRAADRRQRIELIAGFLAIADVDPIIFGVEVIDVVMAAENGADAALLGRFE